MPSEPAGAACLLVAKPPADMPEALRVDLLVALDGVCRVERGTIARLRQIFAGETTALVLLDSYAEVAGEDELLLVAFAPARRIDVLSFMLEAGCEQFHQYPNGRSE